MSGEAAALRSFVALEIEPRIRERLAGCARELAKRVSGLRATPVERIHLTLSFLGDVEDDLRRRIVPTLADVLARTESFEIELRGIGCFPGATRPRVLWAGVADPAPVVALAASVRTGLEFLGSIDTKPFRPHVTIGRFRSPGRIRGLAEELASHQGTAFGTSPVDGVALFASHMAPGRVEHVVSARVPLRTQVAP